MRRGLVKKPKSPGVGPNAAPARVPPRTSGPNRPGSLAPSVLPVVSGPLLFCPNATHRQCNGTLRKSPHRLPKARMPLSSWIRLDGICQTGSTFRPTSRSCPCRRDHPNSTRSKTSGSSCARTGSPTASSNPMTRSSKLVAEPGTGSSINLGPSCQSE